MKKKKFVEGGSSFIDEFEKSKAKKDTEENPRFETKEGSLVDDVKTETAQGQNKNISDETRRRAMEMVNLDTDAEPLITKDAPVTKPARPSLPTRAAFVKKANKAGFTADQTGGGAALLTRRDRRNTKPLYKSGGSVSSASSRADGCAVKGKTKGRMV